MLLMTPQLLLLLSTCVCSYLAQTATTITATHAHTHRKWLPKSNRWKWSKARWVCGWLRKRKKIKLTLNAAAHVFTKRQQICVGNNIFIILFENVFVVNRSSRNSRLTRSHLAIIHNHCINITFFAASQRVLWYVHNYCSLTLLGAYIWNITHAHTLTSLRKLSHICHYTLNGVSLAWIS